jgi:hypothetical protein
MTALRQKRSFHKPSLRDSLSPPFVIFMKRQAAPRQFRSAQIRGFEIVLPASWARSAAASTVMLLHPTTQGLPIWRATRAA